MAPYFYNYITWYDLTSPLGIHNFIQEMKDNKVDIKKYPEIDIYYNVLCNNSFKEEPNMITVDYVIIKLKNALVRYGFAHRVKDVKEGYYYFWKGD